MKKLTVYLSLIAFCMLMLFCRNKLKTSEKAINLGAYREWPEGLSIELYETGGMVPEWQTVRITDKECFFVTWRENLENRYDFTLTGAERNQLLFDLVANNIDGLGKKKSDEIIYDGGSTSLTISLQSKTVIIDNGPDWTISEKRSGDFIGIYNLIHAVKANKVSAYKRTCCFALDPALKLVEGELHILDIRNKVSYQSSTSQIPERQCFDVLSGHQVFQIHIIQPNNTNQKLKYFASAYPSFNIASDTLINVTMKDGQLEWTKK